MIFNVIITYIIFCILYVLEVYFSEGSGENTLHWPYQNRIRLQILMFLSCHQWAFRVSSATPSKK